MRTMTPVSLLGFAGVGLEVLWVASITLVILVLALLAAAANCFFRSVDRFDDDVREATMDLSPLARRRFFDLYESCRPKNAAVAWFLAVGLGPAGANLYRGQWLAFFAAVVSLNGLGAWWLESWFTTPGLVLMENRSIIAWARKGAHEDLGHGRDREGEPELVPPVLHPMLISL